MCCKIYVKFKFIKHKLQKSFCKIFRLVAAMLQVFLSVNETTCFGNAEMKGIGDNLEGKFWCKPLVSVKFNNFDKKG